MTANIEAITALFPVRATAGPGPVTAVSASLGGAVPYDAIQACGIGALAPALVAAVEEIRADPSWAAVYNGDLTRYAGDHSAADLALCGEFARRGLSPAFIDTALRTSALYRPKWERGDYRARTIALAVGGSGSSAPLPLLPPPPPPPPTTTTLPRLPLLAPHNGRVDAGTMAPPPRNWLVEGMLPMGKSAVLAGLGGASKTQLALSMSIAVAIGSPFAGRKTQPGKVMFLSGEEEREELKRRINAQIRYCQLPPTEIDLIRNNLLAFDLVGEDIRLSVPKAGALEPTGFASQIMQTASVLRDVRLIVLDHVGLVHGGDFNAKQDAALTMRIVNELAIQTGAAVILLAHSPKGAVNAEEADATMVFGSSAFIEQARGAWILAKMNKPQAKQLGVPDADRDRYVALTGVKANYTPGGQELWFRRIGQDEVGVLEHVTLTPAIKQAKSVATLPAFILQAVAQAPGRYSKTKLRDTFQGKKGGAWNASKAEIESGVDDMLQHGHLVNRPPTVLERGLYSHGPQVKHVLDVPPKPGAAV